MSYKAAVITVSDKGYKGERVDTAGPAVVQMLTEQGFEVTHRGLVPDEKALICAELLSCCDEKQLPLVVTVGGTGFSPRDITPEATLSVVERETPGIPELMRLESLKITPRGCLSRAAAGIRKKSLIINLPGSEKAAKENFAAVLPSLGHGLEMLLSQGSANCAEKEEKRSAPSADEWLREAKAEQASGKCGMYLLHNGVVRETAKALVRGNAQGTPQVKAMQFSFDREKVEQAKAETLALPGIETVKVWLNQGRLLPGEDLMLVLVGGDIRPRVVEALQFLVEKLKTQCVTETEIFE